jgi:hypothetical protein
MGILLSTAYFPPVQYISKFLFNEPVFIEKHESYQKQSYRNRCCIYGANGRQCLVIPVKKIHDDKTPIAAVQIDYTSDWRRIHLKSIESAYRLSAFYEYYADDIHNLYTDELPYLFDWNISLLKLILRWTGIGNEPAETNSWEKHTELKDYRQSIHPKKRLARPDEHFAPVTYQQVFIERFGFLPNLSMIDLLFNEGPEALSVLKKSIR